MLSEDRYHCLGTERDKVGYFAQYLTRDVSWEYPLHWYPHIAFGEGRQRTYRLFPDKLPIGVEKDGYRRHLFLYLATRPHPWDFRLFLLRHATLLQSVSDWCLRVLLPRRLRKAKALYHAAFVDQLLRPLEPYTVERLEAFFKQCRETHRHISEPEDEHLAKVYRQFGATRFRAPYRVWPRLGDVLTFEFLIKDKYERGDAGIEYQELRRQYLLLTALISHDGSPESDDLSLQASLVAAPGHDYPVRGSETRTLTIVGAFRACP